MTSALLALLILSAPCTETTEVREGETVMCSGELAPPGETQILLDAQDSARHSQVDLTASQQTLAAERKAWDKERTAMQLRIDHLQVLANTPTVVERGWPSWKSALVCTAAGGAGFAFGYVVRGK